MPNLRPCFLLYKCINDPQKGNPQHALKDKGVTDSGCSRYMTGNMSYMSDFEEINGGYVAFNPKGGKITRKGKIKIELLRVPRENNMYNVDLKNIVPSGDLTCLFAKATFDEFNLLHRRLRYINFKTMNKLVKEKAGEENVQQYVLFPLWSSGYKNPQNTDDDAAFGGKNPEFDGKKPESEVHVSPSSKFEDFSNNSINKVNAVDSPVLAVGKIYTNCTNTFSAAGPSNTAVSPIHGKSSYVDTSQYLDDLNMPALEDITYSDDEEDVGAEADFTNLETKIIVSPIPTTRVHKDHPVTQSIGDLSLATQTRSMTRVVKDQGFEDPDYPNKVYKVVKTLYGLHQAPRACHDKYVAEILRKFVLTDVKLASTPIGTEKPLLKDPDGEDVDVHTYRSMIGSLMYLTSSRPDIMFAVYACARFQVTPTVSHLHAVNRIFRYLKGKPHLGLWYLKDSPFNLVTYSDSDYVGASLDRKSTTGGCQFLGCRLISWKCNKQIVVATSCTEAEYVAAPSYCAQVLWIQNQLLDYGVGKGFSRVETPLFDGMIVAQQADNVADEGVAGVDVDVVLDAAAEPSIPPPTPTTQPPSQELPFTSQVIPTPPPSPIDEPSSPPQQQQPSQPTHDAAISLNLLHTLMETCTTLTRKVEALKQDKVAQALEIIKLKQRVKKLERKNKLKVSGLRRLRKVGTAQRVESSVYTVMDDQEDASKQGEIIDNIDADEDVTLKDVVAVKKDAEIEENADVQGRQAESQAKIYKIDLEHADNVLSMQDDELEPTKLKEVVEVVSTAKLMTRVVTAASATITVATTPITTATITSAPSATRRRKGVVIRDPEEIATPSIIIHSEPKSKDKGKGIMVEEPKPLKKQAQIEQDEAYARELEAELNKNIDWDEVIEQVQRKEKEYNDVMRFKMEYFKGISYDGICPTFEKYFNSNVAFLEKTKEQMEEKDIIALKRKTKSSTENVVKKQKFDEEVPVVDYEIYTYNKKPYYKIIRADESHQLFLSFLSLLRNFDREDLEVLWQLVKERFASSKPKNFSDDFLLTTLTYMFEKPDVQAQVWKNQRSFYGLAKVKSWRLLESCGVHIIKFTTTQMILLVDRRYLLTRFTLDQMLNIVRLEVKEESEVSLELLRFIRQQQQQEGFRLE
nr:hypothetical protein [Tanacetum cinerariifolium]